MTDTAKATWSEVVTWAKREVETARTALETATPADLPAIQARISVMRELQAINTLPTPADMPPPTPYA